MLGTNRNRRNQSFNQAGPKGTPGVSQNGGPRFWLQGNQTRNPPLLLGLALRNTNGPLPPPSGLLRLPSLPLRRSRELILGCTSASPSAQLSSMHPNRSLVQEPLPTNRCSSCIESTHQARRKKRKRQHGRFALLLTNSATFDGMPERNFCKSRSLRSRCDRYGDALNNKPIPPK